MGLFGSTYKVLGRSVDKNFAEFSDNIFSAEDSSEIDMIRKELVTSYEQEEYIPLAKECWFKASKTEDDGIMLHFADNEKAAGERNLYLSKDDSVVFFDEMTAAYMGIWNKVNLEDKINGIDYTISNSQSGLSELLIMTNGKISVKLAGSKAIFQKILIYLLYAKYYKR